MTVLENVMVGLDRASRYSLLEAALHIGRYFPAERAAKAKAMAIWRTSASPTSPICRPQT